MDWQPISTAPRDGTMFLCWVSAVLAERERMIEVVRQQAEALAENLYGHPREKAREWAKEDKFDSAYNVAEELLEIVAAAIRKGE